MFLESYKFKDYAKKSWQIDEINFHHVNLIVGRSGMGKSKLLNTISNLFLMLQGKKRFSGEWHLTFSILEDHYTWSIIVSESKIESEHLKINDIIVIERSVDRFIYLEKELPSLNQSQAAFQLLADEEKIKPVISCFNKIVRRNFYDRDLVEQCAAATLSNKESSLIPLNSENFDVPIVLRLGQLLNQDKKRFEKLKIVFLEMFDEFNDLNFMPIGNLHGQSLFQVFVKSGEDKILLQDLSSGIQKSLLILTDIFTIDNESVYLIDEIENSLGDNIIDKIPDIISEYGTKTQFLFTSHHPYIINKIPVDNWIIVKRENKHIKVVQGNNLAPEFKKSKQKMFTMLQNMDFY